MNTLLNVRKVDAQLEEEIYINGYSRGGGCMTMQYCGNCNKPGYNTRICKKDEQMFNVYSSE